jgi:hypothetical protein
MWEIELTSTLGTEYVTLWEMTMKYCEWYKSMYNETYHESRAVALV